MIMVRKWNEADIEKYLVRILREISNLKEVVNRMNEKLTKTTSYSNSFMVRKS